MWDATTGKVVPIDRVGRKWEIEVKVPKEEEKTEKGATFMSYGKTFRRREAGGGHCGAHSICTHNKYEGLDSDNCNLGFVGQGKR